MNVRHTEAALAVVGGLLAFLKHFRIDHCPPESLKIGIHIGYVVAVHHQDPAAVPHLRSSQSHTVGMLHGLEHIVYILAELCLIRLLYIHLLGYFPEHFGAIYINR